MKTRHFAQLVGLSAMWGASFPLIRVASPAFGPWATAGLRCALGALVLVVLMRAMRQAWPARSAWLPLGAVGVLTMAAPFVLFNFAGLVLPAGYSAVLNATAPLFGVLAAAVVGDEKLSTRSLLGCAFGFAGVALLVQLGPVAVTGPVVLGALACIAAAASYGVGTIYMKRATRIHQPLAASAVIAITGALLLAVPIGVAVPAMQHSLGVWVAIGVLGLGTTGLMYWVSMRLMREISSSASTSAAFMIPLFGVTWGALFLGEPVTLGMLPGCVLILLATALITGFNPFRAAPPAP